ncbi:kinase-like protein [Phaeosphaeriaceae sp. SRC1lsM3a]|nr:kinase-like protein [Stagonospora sp. SRC1lsM3a]
MEQYKQPQSQALEQPRQPVQDTPAEHVAEERSTLSRLVDECYRTQEARVASRGGTQNLLQKLAQSLDLLRVAEGPRQPWMEEKIVRQNELDRRAEPTPKRDRHLDRACLTWKGQFGSRQVKFEPKDPSPLTQGVVLGRGGLGVVYRTEVGGVNVAWKRTYTRRLTEWHMNEINILDNMPDESHRHIIELVGSYIHRHRGMFEVAVITWPVAKCDMSSVLHDMDILLELEQGKDSEENMYQPPTSNPKSSRDHHSLGEEREEDIAIENLRQLHPLYKQMAKRSEWRRKAHGKSFRHELHAATAKRLAQAMGCMAEALRFLHHHNIRHKDMKPSQILLSSKGLRLTDFGLSKDTSHLTSSETSGGERITIRYHAPERQLQQRCGKPEDIFALGCTYLEMAYRICGLDSNKYLNNDKAPMWSFQANINSIDAWLAPFEQSTQTLLRAMPTGLIRAMLTDDPKERPSIDEVIARLTEVSKWRVKFFGACCNPNAHDGSSDDSLYELFRNSDEDDSSDNSSEISSDTDARVKKAGARQRATKKQQQQKSIKKRYKKRQESSTDDETSESSPESSSTEESIAEGRISLQARTQAATESTAPIKRLKGRRATKARIERARQKRLDRGLPIF